MKNLFIRTISGSLYVFLLVLSLIAGKITFGIFFLVILIIAIYELYRIFNILNYFPYKIWGYFSAIFTFIISYLVHAEFLSIKYFLLIIILFLMLFIMEMFYNYKNNNVLVNISINYFIFI